MLDPDSLERLVPDELDAHGATAGETLRLHLERYEFAARHARPGRLLDMACGVGYGTRLLRDRVSGLESALGVDLSDSAVAYARGRYGKDGLAYRQGDATQFRDGDGFDTVVSLETVEHVTDPARLVDRLVSVLRVGGTLVASVPTTPSTDVNPHHLSDFTERSFRAMVARPGLREVDAFRQVQPFSPFAVATRSESRMKGMREHLVRYYAMHPRHAIRRVAATLRYGFSNRYVTIAWRRDA